MTRRPVAPPLASPVTWRQGLWFALALSLPLAPAAGRAQAASAPAPAPAAAVAESALPPWRLPSAAAVQAAFEQAPAAGWVRAQLDAERAGARALALGSAEWQLSVNTARHRQTDPSAGWTEWELGAERPWRSGHKQGLAERAGQARVAAAQAQAQRAWRAHAEQVLERWVAWQREAEAARVQAGLAELLARQAAAVDTRTRLGDAARVERDQAQAALQQARAQAEAAQARASLAREALWLVLPQADALAPEPAASPGGAATDFGPLPATALPTAPPPAPDTAADQAAIDAQLQHDPELALARAEAQALAAAARVDAAERRPDPTLGVRVGAQRGGAERWVGLSLSLPLPGAARDATAEAAARRAEAAERQADALARQRRLDALQRLREAAAAQAQWARQHDAALRLHRVADALARGFALGEGSLSDLLAARRVAHEQALAAAQAWVERGATQARLALASGQLWPAPAAQVPMPTLQDASARR